MGIRYGGSIYETMGAAQRAAIDDYLTARGRQDVQDAIDPDDTPESIARDMVAGQWTVPGVCLHASGPPEYDRLAHLIRDRLQAHGVDCS